MQPPNEDADDNVGANGDDDYAGPMAMTMIITMAMVIVMTMARRPQSVVHRPTFAVRPPSAVVRRRLHRLHSSPRVCPLPPPRGAANEKIRGLAKHHCKR